LLARVLEALGVDADASEDRLPEVALAAAKRTLDALLGDQRFGRDSAVYLLAVDALMTYAYEYASRLGSRDRVEAFATQGVRMLGQLTNQHV
jgi:hypothetical protein